MPRPRGQAALWTTPDIAAKTAALFEPTEEVASTDFFLATIVPVDEQKLVVPIGCVEEDDGDGASAVSPIRTDNVVANLEGYGRHCETAYRAYSHFCTASATSPGRRGARRVR